jgi:hypothetical protein
MTDWLQVKNNSASELALAVNSGATELILKTGEGSRFPASFPFHITIDDEILSVTARTNDTLTVARAQEGTSAAAHNAGAAVRLNITAALIAELQTAIDTKQAALPLTDKGDLLAFSTVLTRVPVGTNGQYLVADNTQDAGVKWGTLSLGSMAYKSSGSYTGNDTANRAIPHGLGVIPILVLIWYRKITSPYNSYFAVQNPNIAALFGFYGDMSTGYWMMRTDLSLTAINATNFYIGDSSDYPKSMNGAGLTYYWAAIG